MLTSKKTKPHKRQASKAYWLNIVILVVAAMILFLVLLGKMMNSGDSSKLLPTEPLQEEISPQSLTLSIIDFGDYSFVKQSNSWMVNGELSEGLSSRDIEERIYQWQQLLTESGDKYRKPDFGGKTILLYFANLSQPIVCKFKIVEKQLNFYFVAQGQILRRPANEYSIFFPQVN